MTINYLAPRVPLINLKDGTATREFYLFLQELFSLSGGLDGSEIGLISPTSDGDIFGAQVTELAGQLALNPVLSPITVIDAPSDIQPPAQQFFVSIEDVLPVIGSLRDEVAMLNAKIASLEQGTIIL